MVDQFFLELLLHDLAVEARKILPKEETLKKAES